MQNATRVPPRSRAPQSRSSLLGPIGSAVVGAAWLAIAGATAWVVFATPTLARVVSLEVRGSATPVLGAVVWAVALTAPAAFAIVGIARVAGAIGQARRRRPPVPPVTRLAGVLPPGCSVIAGIHLPDGRTIPDVVVGPHGIAFFEQVPPRAAVRRAGDRWEVRFADGSWRQIESPVQRTARDAERLRRELEAREHDFVVRVQAAVLGDPDEIPRADGCAVVPLDDVPGWLAALPAQRGLTPDRLAHLREVLDSLA